MSQAPLAPQDGPPPEGYRIPKYGRNLPKSGLSSIALAIGGTGVFAFGMYKIIMGNRQRRCGAARRPQILRIATTHVPSPPRPPAAPPLLPSPRRRSTPPAPFPRPRRQWAQEDMDIRLAILPFLSAENDVQSDFLHERIKLNEAELMKDVAGWEAGANVYKSRYMRPMAPPLMQNDMSQM